MNRREELLVITMEECAEVSPDFDAWTACVRKSGEQLSIITYGGMLPRAMEAAALLQQQGLDVEVIDCELSAFYADSPTDLGDVRVDLTATVPFVIGL